MMNNNEPKKIPIDDINIDELQFRAAVNEEAVEDYLNRMKAGDEFPPIKVFSKNGRFVLLDGRHRLEAARCNHQRDITAEVWEGEWEQAVQIGLAANATHGLRRTNADKHQSAKVALQTWPDYADRRLANICVLHHSTIAAVRRDSTGGISQLEVAKRQGADGKIRRMPNRDHSKSPAAPAGNAPTIPEAQGSNENSPATEVAEKNLNADPINTRTETYSEGPEDHPRNEPVNGAANEADACERTGTNGQEQALAEELERRLIDFRMARHNLVELKHSAATKLSKEEDECFRRGLYHLEAGLKKHDPDTKAATVL